MPTRRRPKLLHKFSTAYQQGCGRPIFTPEPCVVCAPFDRTLGCGLSVEADNSRGDRNFRRECGWISQ